jgi:hypothetical protein
MIQKLGGWQLLHDPKIWKIVQMLSVNGNALPYPANVNSISSDRQQLCDMVSLESSSEIGETNTVLPLLPKLESKESSSIAGKPHLDLALNALTHSY